MFKKSLLIFVCLVLALMAVPAESASPGAPGEFTTIDYPGALHTFAWGLNSRGDIVGSYYDSSFDEHGFLLRNGTFISFDYPGAAWTQAWGISDQGDIIGQYGLPDENTVFTIHGFLLRKGIFTTMDIPGQPNTMPVKISPNGTIVGCYHASNPNGSTNLDTMYGFSMSAQDTLTTH